LLDKSVNGLKVPDSRPAPEAFTVKYQTGNGPARAGQDHMATSGKLKIAEDQTTASVPVKVKGTGGAGALFGPGGNDVIKALGGNDRYWIENSGDRVLEDRNEGYDTVFASRSCKLENHVEALKLNGRANPDGTGSGLNNRIVGNSGRHAVC
jgi:hypothetical protein